MADTVARLIFETDTKGLDDANKKLDDLGKTGQATGGKLPKKPLKETATAAENLSQRFSQAATATAALQGPLNGLSGRLSFISTGLTKIGVAGLLVSTSLFGLAFATKRALNELQEFETQMFKIDALIKATGGAAGLTSDQINEMAVSLGELTLASANEMRGAAAVLLTFKSITSDVFQSTLTLTQDIGHVMGQTAISGAKQLGKALEDPMRNMEALRRVGVSFNDEQKSLITNMQRSGDIVGAQTELIKILEGQIGGAGEGGGLAQATDLLAHNTERVAIKFAEASGVGEAYKSFINSLATVTGAMAKETSLEDQLANAQQALDNFNTKNVATQLQAIPVMFGTQFTEIPVDGAALQARVDQLKAEIQAEKDSQAEKQRLKQEQIDATNAANVAEFETFKRKENLKTLAAQESEQMQTGNLRAAAVTRVAIAQEQADIERDAAIKKHGDLEVFQETHTAKMKAITAKFNADIAAITEGETDSADKASKEADKAAAEKEALEQGFLEQRIQAEEHEATLQNNLVVAHERKMELLIEQQAIELENANNHNASITELEEAHRLERANLAAVQAKETLKIDEKTATTQKKIQLSMAKSALSILGSIGANSKKVKVAMLAADVGIGLAENKINTEIEVSAARATGPAGIALEPAIRTASALRAAAIVAAGAMKIHNATSGGGGGGGGSAAAEQAPTAPEPLESFVESPRTINLTIDNSIDPEGARRIVEAINEVSGDGLMIDAVAI